MTPDEMVAAALAVAEAGPAAGEQPIGAVVVLGDEIVGRAARWRPTPDMTWFAAPVMTGGIRREESRELFRRYCATATGSGMRRWAEALVQRT